MSAPSNIAVRHAGSSFYASCFYKGARFHIWLDATHDRTTVYKNPPLGTRPSDPGYYSTRRLDSTSGQGKVVYDALTAAAPALLKIAQEAKARAEEERRLADEEMQREEDARKRLEDAAPALYRALGKLIVHAGDQLEAGGVAGFEALLEARAAVAMAGEQPTA